MNFLAQTYEYNYSYGSGDAATDSAVGAAFAGVFMLIWTIVAIILAIPAIITLWVLFTKAGQPGWKAIVPIYNIYTFGKIAKVSDGMIWGYIISTILCVIPLINFIAWIPALILGILILIEFAKQYDKDVVFWLLFIFLPIIAVFLVKDAKYTGGVAKSSAGAGASSAPTPAESKSEETK